MFVFFVLFCFVFSLFSPIVKCPHDTEQLNHHAKSSDEAYAAACPKEESVLQPTTKSLTRKEQQRYTHTRTHVNPTGTTQVEWSDTKYTQKKASEKEGNMLAIVRIGLRAKQSRPSASHTGKHTLISMTRHTNGSRPRYSFFWRRRLLGFGEKEAT